LAVTNQLYGRWMVQFGELNRNQSSVSGYTNIANAVPFS